VRKCVFNNSFFVFLFFQFKKNILISFDATTATTELGKQMKSYEDSTNPKRFKKESNEDQNDQKQAHFWELILNKLELGERGGDILWFKIGFVRMYFGY